MIGGTAVSHVMVKPDRTDFNIYFQDWLELGDTIKGTLTATLLGEIWAPVGTTGILANGQGTWSMIAPSISAVPLPAGLPLLLAGLGAFGLVRKRRSA